jgi:hypothetical protein
MTSSRTATSINIATWFRVKRQAHEIDRGYDPKSIGYKVCALEEMTTFEVHAK